MTDQHPEDMPIEELVASLRLDGFDPSDRGGSSEPLGGQPVNWRDLDGKDARKTWDDLRQWVEWVTTRYDIPEVIVPTCWWRHGALVEELSALRTAWEAAFDPTDAGFGPIGWHERFAIARPRLKAAYPGSCINGHRDRTPRTWKDATDEGEWDAWVDQAHAR
ncbi:hypothetical protein [Microbacterium mangrovi]|uniref:hypothetical protein n=1 Tax=Microbacterium mangrovi TaxID=1348253 RepID=UPI000690E571|nr:hypothetical protein [Microbacterium mangrovi]